MLINRDSLVDITMHLSEENVCENVMVIWQVVYVA